MEQAHPGGVVQGQAEVEEWAVPAGEEWAAPERVQVQKGSACALNVARLCHTKRESHVTTGNVPSVVRKW